MSADGAKREKRGEQDRNPFAFPEGVYGNRLEDADDESPLAPLCTVAQADAIGIVEKLETEGIVCELGEAADGTATVLVHEEDVGHAREVAARPLAPLGHEDDFGDDYYIERKQCPHCHAQLEELPLSRPWWWFRVFCAMVVVLPMGVLVVCSYLKSANAIWRRASEWVCTWIAAVFVFSVLAVLNPRRLHCPGCGWRLGGNRPACIPSRRR